MRGNFFFYHFYHSEFQSPSGPLPISPVIALFIAYLFYSHYAPSTVTTYISALGYPHKLMGSSDPAKIFFIAQMLKNYNKMSFRLDNRLPITPPILDMLISIAGRLPGHSYQVSQFQVMCSLAFFAFLRIGETTLGSGRGANLHLQLKQLTKLLNPDGALVAYKLTFGNFKHHYNRRPWSIVIYCISLGLVWSNYCPNSITWLSGVNGPGPIFITVNGLPISRSTFSVQVSLAVCHDVGSPLFFTRVIAFALVLPRMP